MDLTTLEHTPAGGWSAPLPDLDSPQTLVLAFAAAEHRDDPRPLRDLAAAYPRSHVLGCSTAGEIHGTHLSDGTVAIAVARFGAVGLRSASASCLGDGGSYRAGREIGAALAEADLRAVLVLSDGLLANGSELTCGLRGALPRGVVVSGGLAGDGDRFGHTWVIHEGVPGTGMVTAVGLYGPRLSVGHGSRGGWDPFGPERLVTRSEGNVLHELDGRPALALYREYLGDLADGLPAAGLKFPLAVRAGRDDPSLVRTILAVDEDAQTLTFAGDVPLGAMVRLMRANRERLVEGAGEAAGDAGTDASAGPALCVGVSCVGRRLVLGERTEEEIEAVLDGLPPGTRQVGFYSYGEISPAGAGRCDLHNQTMTLTTLAERP